ncbi:hypothetical protein [Lachnobacterium bovis]|uniref:hypothetical protein n=1 Tax=Lachnobacterium bovis TaxID=140626 RepID=UPI00048A6112|nr:hypothetical protein [Lachnobacterium bovis]
MANSKSPEKPENENNTQEKSMTENNNVGTEEPEQNSTSKTETEKQKETAVKEYKQQALDQSEEMAEEIQKMIDQAGMTNNIQVDFNQQYVQLNVQGALLFDSGKSDVKPEASGNPR